VIPPATLHLSTKCQTETENFLHQRRYDPQYCYELFVRAFRHNDSVAFAQLLIVYKALVIHWAKRHSLYHTLCDEREKIAHYAFTKMWRSTRGERFRFDTLPAILAYLRDCIDAALLEMYRDLIGQKRGVALPAPDISEPKMEEEPEFELLWQRVMLVLPEPELQHLVWYSFVAGYKPEELVRDFPYHYDDKEVVRILKQKAMRRLRKDPFIRRWFGLPPDSSV
jgi:hypothetical protein